MFNTCLESIHVYDGGAMESSLSQLNPYNSTACLSLNNPPFKLNQNTKLQSLLMAKFEKVLGVIN